MSDRKDGGPAFPQGDSTEYGGDVTGGMTLRQWYAGMALHGIMANPDCTNSSITTVANQAVTMADALIGVEKETDADIERLRAALAGIT